MPGRVRTAVLHAPARAPWRWPGKPSRSYLAWFQTTTPPWGLRAMLAGCRWAQPGRRDERGGSRRAGHCRLVQGELVALLGESVPDNRPVDRAGTDPHRSFDEAIRIGPVGWVTPGHLVVVEDVGQVPGSEGAGQPYLSGDVA